MKKKPTKKAPPKKAQTKKTPAKRKIAVKARPKAKAPPPPRPPRAPGETRYWLLKTEPEVFSFTDLAAAPNRTTFWDGVRNFQARNTLRDEMKLGDGVLIYHSNADPPAIVGVAEIVREGYPDHTQFDAKHHHFDPTADATDPRWFMVDVKAIAPLERSLGLPELHEVVELKGMTLLQKGSRLSVQPVSVEQWATVLRLGGRIASSRPS